ncbi:sodium/proline symporter PutP [Saezia sanguinis]|uniref:sodium/proline symporter PutP n=1 Tax=Saezia sanguinis TaxID=1965230 RepID=UPI00305D6758
MDVGTPLIITFVLYIALMILIGLIAYRSTNNLSDYILGGRKLGGLVTGLSAGASDMSGWLLMGLPGAVFVSGIAESWIAIGLILGAWCNWLFVAGRLRVHTEYNDNALTLPDYFTSRFEDRSRILRIISALVILIFFTVYCASGVVAGAKLFNSTFNIDYSTALWVGAAATIFYVFIGGFLAVSWTDTVQATLMIFALLITPVMVILAIGDFSGTIETIKQIDPDNINMFKGIFDNGFIPGMVIFLSLVGWGLGYVGQPHILVRFMAAKSVKTMKSARRIGMTWMILCLAGAVAVGFFGIGYFAQHPELAGPVTNTVAGDNKHEAIFLELVKLLFNPWVGGVVLSGVLAAVMSTLSCQLLVCSSALTEDLYKGFVRPNASQKELVWFGRAMVLVIALVAIAIAYNPQSKVLGLVSNAWAGFGASFGPVIVLSLVWKRITRNGALAGMLVGALTVIVWIANDKFGTGLYEIIPGFLFSCIAIVVVSLMGKEPSASIQKRFEEADRQYKLEK